MKHFTNLSAIIVVTSVAGLWCILCDCSYVHPYWSCVLGGLSWGEVLSAVANRTPALQDPDQQSDCRSLKSQPAMMILV